MKTCIKCKIPKQAQDFYKNKVMKDGLHSLCIECHKIDNRARKAKSRINPVFKAKESAYKKEYRQRTVEQRAAYMLEWRKKNKQRTSDYGKEYRAKRKEHYHFLCQKRKMDTLNRTPKWLTENDFWMIEEAYDLASIRTKVFGFSWHVDHVVPLRGKNVSGFHMPANLQVVPWLDNQRKTNKFEV
jgi:hypothetical protein